MSVVQVFGMSEGGRMVMFECPGCGYNHGVAIEREQAPCWTWNGDVEKPTIRASILARTGHATGAKVCHSFVTDGRIQFLDDCTHHLKGQIVDLPQITE